MIMILIDTTITYFWLKPEIYLKKVPVMTNNTLAQTIGFVNIKHIFQAHQSYNILTFIIYTNIRLRKLVDCT